MKRVMVGLLAATCLFYTDAESESREDVQSAVDETWGWGHKTKPTEMDFTVEIIDGISHQLAGVNRHGEIAGSTGTSMHWRGVLINRQGTATEFSCLVFDRPDEPYTLPSAINNDGTITGSCGSGTFAFVRRKGGYLYQFSIPGADYTSAYAMNDREDIVGESVNVVPGREAVHKSFLRKADGQVITLSADALIANAFTRATGINNRGQVVGSYSNDNFDDFKWGSFLYDNGQYTDLPKDMLAKAINNDGTILMQKTNGQYVLYDDNKVFTIAIPEPYKWDSILGLTDKGELFGWVRTGTFPNVKFLRVIATPK